jgi:hypothetical protein
VHLDLLRSVWERPATERPVLEPLFAAGFHGIELALILLAQFVSDGRRCGRSWCHVHASVRQLAR